MYPKESGQGDGPVRTSDRPRRSPKQYTRFANFYTTHKKHVKRKKSKTRTAASRIAKIISSGNRSAVALSANSVAANLRRSTRKRRTTVNLEDYTDSSGTEDNDIMNPSYGRSRSRSSNRTNQGQLLPRHEPRRAGLRPRRGRSAPREQENLEYVDDEVSSEEDKVSEDGEENRNSEDNDVDDGEDEDEVDRDGDREDEGDGEGEGEGEGEDDDEGEEDGDDEEGEEEQEGRRRYDLRNREDVRRRLDESKQRPRSPRRVLQQGMGTKVSSRDARRGGPRVHKRHRSTRAEDSDDSLLVDELDQGPSIPWGRSGSRAGPPWLLGGLDMHGTSAWGLNAAASGWSHQNDAITNLTSGIQTAGPSSKGGADIQPLQLDESISFDDIGGLSEYIDALKEMVFFPLLYPDFFANYHITPPRGVLLCGPPGTGKTLIARALACAASKAGQKVSFYMRKGADVLSKWVGEAERQLKLLFEEAQRNQPSIIFFDEIDGLAPVRSSKQEQIHNSIVSTLLALMDGLDSRGQVVLIGATNRIDAIDGALRRPGRFDREFNFQLPGCDARAEILDIHTRKWKQPPSNELKLELAASCVGYCGADLKALCTEAAIRAFREKYPQVYTSDDKFVIDVDSVEVEKFHFIEAMSAITPAAHRGSIVQSRPLSSVVAPCLQTHFREIMSTISDIFPVVSVSADLSKLSELSYGSGVPLVYRPKLLLCGGDGVGLDHLGPAILHELEKFPVHSLGLPSLLSDPSAKTPEEALVHIFGEARRTTPSILYLPQFHLWVQNAHEQLKAVLWTLLEELPSDFPILLLGTCSLPLDELDTDHFSVFPLHNVYVAHKPSAEDRSLFFDRLIQAALSISNDSKTKNSQKSASLPELPKAPKVDTGPKISELKLKAETEGHALRRLRMCLRDICNRILYDKRFSAFHYPVTDEDAPNYRSIIQKPMDMSTLLQHVDSGKYITCKAFLEDFDLILINAMKYNGDDYNGARIVSRACELRDTVHGMLSQVDPALAALCEKIAAEGGPVSLPDDLGDSLIYQAPVVQMATMTRASARLRNVQPEVNLDQSYEVLKRTKKSSDAAQTVETGKESLVPQEPVHLKSQEPEIVDLNQRVESPVADSSPMEEASREVYESRSPDVNMSEAEDTSKIEPLKQRLVERSEDYGIPQLERLYARVIKGVFDTKAGKSRDVIKDSILSYMFKFVEDEANF